MEKIINNLLYDTNDAVLINIYCDFDSSLLSSYHLNEYLYITKNNRFFLYTYETKFIILSYDYKEEIKELSTKEAYEYMCKRCPGKVALYFKIERA